MGRCLCMMSGRLKRSKPTKGCHSYFEQGTEGDPINEIESGITTMKTVFAESIVCIKDLGMKVRIL